MRRLLIVLFILVAPPAAAVEVPDLYGATAHVTGQFEPERSRGFRAALAEVLVKLTGRPDLPQRLPEAIARAGDYVADFSYEDKMKGIPLHDEQGTRERPYALSVTFERAKVDALLATAGVRQWPADRPLVGVRLTITDARGSYLLTADGDRGFGQRWALRDAATAAGVPIALPPQEGEERLEGTLSLEESGTWAIAWTFPHGGEAQVWRAEGVSFDDAMRLGMGETARMLSGSGVATDGGSRASDGSAAGR